MDDCPGSGCCHSADRRRADAAPDRVTRGQAEAIAQGYGTGGQVLRSNGASVTGAPADFAGVATIRPFDAPEGADAAISAPTTGMSS